ncbi:MAG: hypothetical protein ACOCUR_00075 [Nanoarchaeota archaeon]
MKVYIMMAVFVSLFLVACTPEQVPDEYPPMGDDVSEEEYCAAMEGTWREFPDACADTCEAQRAEEDAMCAQVVTESCDCGEGMCWTGTTCVPI